MDQDKKIQVENESANTGYQNEVQNGKNSKDTRRIFFRSLIQLDDRDSSWEKSDGLWYYLAAKDKYTGINSFQDLLPLWIYQGETEPKYSETGNAGWIFYDRAPTLLRKRHHIPPFLAADLEILRNINSREKKRRAAYFESLEKKGLVHRADNGKLVIIGEQELAPEETPNTLWSMVNQFFKIGRSN